MAGLKRPWQYATMEKWDHLWINANLATMRANDRYLGVVLNGAIGIRSNRISFAGPMRDLPGAPDALAARIHDCNGQWIMPGFIDCHTHLVFSGNRASEWAMRLAGMSYEEISRGGGGIMSTVRDTMFENEADLAASCAGRLKLLAAEGVTTVEIKSGYGLDVKNELKTLRAARAAAKTVGIRVVGTFLGLHALPPGPGLIPAMTRAEYVNMMIGLGLDAVAESGLATAVDAFCEGIAFTVEEIERFFAAATARGLRVKLHADQLSDTGGAALAAKYNALSADHLEHTNPEGVTAMAKAGTVAVLLPGAYYFLRETKLPPVEQLRAQNVPIAIATDCNPGTSPMVSLLTAMSMACTLFQLKPEEALAGVTRNAARALGLQDEVGTLDVGKAADFAVWPITVPSELCYWVGGLRPSYVHSSNANHA